VLRGLLVNGILACLVSLLIQELNGISYVERALSYHREKSELARINMTKLAEFIERLSYKPRASISLHDLLALHRLVLGPIVCRQIAYGTCAYYRI
jgi:hypothetical protein